MAEERNDRTIGNLRTWGPGGPLPEEESVGGTSGWNPSQTIGGLETMRPGNTGEMLLAGRYKVVRRLGDGGMGSVWLAEDTKLDGRLVAVKMLPAVLAGKKGAYRQVKQEALMAMKLSHSNIATVRAFEEDEGGAPFLVMDYIEGKGLDDILSERGPLGEEELLKLLGPVAAALDYAHSQGVVHRDVKPGNVMVRKDGTPFVLDFGIAREIQETMTKVTGKFAGGTLLYMSPEQLRGRAPKATQDVYSFAAMAYECLTGHPPFYRGGVEDQIKNEPPEELEEGVASAGVRKGIMAGLAKVPEGRPGSCMGVLEMAIGGGSSRPGEPESWRMAGAGAGELVEHQRKTMDSTWPAFKDVSIEPAGEWRRSVDCEPLECVGKQVLPEMGQTKGKQQPPQPVGHPGRRRFVILIQVIAVLLFLGIGKYFLGYISSSKTAARVMMWGLWALILGLWLKLWLKKKN